MKAIVIPADSSCPARVVDERLTLDFLQGVVGGWIEAVNIEQILTDSGRQQVDCTCFVNEEGKLNGLPVNVRATDLAAIAIGGWVRDVIVGDVVIVGPPDDQGDETPCAQRVIDIVKAWGWLDGS